MTIEEQKIFTALAEHTETVVKQQGKIISVLDKAAETIVDLTGRVIHLEKMIGIRK